MALGRPRGGPPPNELNVPNLHEGMWNMLGGAVLVTHLTALPWECFARIPGSMGRRYLGAAALIVGFCGFPLFGHAAGYRYLGPHAFNLWRGLLALMILQGLLARLNPRPRHSLFVGSPWLGLIFGHNRAMMLEAVFGWAIALAVFSPICVPFARFMMYSAIANFFHTALLNHRPVRMAQAAIDGQIEAGEFAGAMERYR